MPCILKKLARKSPGIVTFTHNEALYGLPARSRKVKNYITQTSGKRWIYGVHLQGSLKHLKEWPLEPWQAFISWSNPKSPFLSNVPTEKLIDINHINLLPEFGFTPRPKIWDIIIISRPSKIKRIQESVFIIKKLMLKRPELKTIFIVPTPSRQAKDIDRSFFELPKRLFSTKEMKNTSFIVSPTESFGNFPVSSELISKLISQSKFLLLTSHREGGPRAIGEALLAGTPCIISKNLDTGIVGVFDNKNTLTIDDNIDLATQQINQGLQNYSSFKIDDKKICRLCSERHNKPIFKAKLSKLLTQMSYQVAGEWYLEDLSFRLCGHGRKFSFQSLDDDRQFFFWFDKITSVNPYDEDGLIYHPESLSDYALRKLKRLWQTRR